MECKREESNIIDNEIIKLTKEFYMKFKANKTFNLEKILLGVQKAIDTDKIKNDNHICNLTIKELANEIEQLYPKGIQSLLENQEGSCNSNNKETKSKEAVINVNTSNNYTECNNRNNKLFMSFTLNCSNNFRNKYSYLGKINSALNSYNNYNKHIDKKLDIPNFEENEDDKNNNILNNEDIEDNFKISNTINDKDIEKLNKLIDMKIKKTKNYKKLIFATFEEFDIYENMLLEEVIYRQAQSNSKKIEESNNKEIYSKLYKDRQFDQYKKHSLPYYEFSYEDYIIVICRIIHFFTGIDIQASFSPDLKFYLKFSANHKVLELLAYKYKYELCLKNYGDFYLKAENKYKIEKQQNLDNYNSNSQTQDESNLLVSNIEKRNYSLYELNYENQINFPPYFPYEKDKSTKFMRYTNDDKLHICSNDPELKVYKSDIIDNTGAEKDSIEGESKNEINLFKWDDNDKELLKENNIVNDDSILNKDHDMSNNYEYSPDYKRNNYSNNNNSYIKLSKKNSKDNNKKSKLDFEENNKFEKVQTCCDKFRNIDKLRLIYDDIDSIVSFNNMTKSGIFKGITFMNNYPEYKDNLTLINLCFKSFNIFNSFEQYKYIDLVRNFYGEKISFYFLFMYKLIIWMIFPSIIGIGCFIFERLYHNEQKKANVFITSLNAKNIVSLCYCGIITIWAVLFLDAWTQNEKIYSYIWGTDNFEEIEPKRESFSPDRKERFLFHVKIEKVNQLKYTLKIIFSVLLIILMIGLTIFFNYLLFSLKAEKAKVSSGWNWPIFIAVLNSLQIKIMSLIYKYVTTWTTELENYATETKYENALAIKFIFFEFINNYLSLFYIAYAKKKVEGQCSNNDCIGELNLQIYIILATNLALNILDICIPIILTKVKKYIFKKKSKKLTGNIIKKCERYTLDHQNLLDEYSTTMNDYLECVINFGYVSLFSVICPLTPLLVSILIYFEYKLDTIKLFFYYRVTLISKSDGIEIFRLIFKIIYFLGMTNSIGIIIFTELKTEEYSLPIKLVIFAAVENIVLLLMLGLKVNHLPDWFDNIDMIKQLYFKIFFSKSKSYLPHHFFKDSNRIKEKEAFNEKEFFDKDLGKFVSDIESAN